MTTALATVNSQPGHVTIYGGYSPEQVETMKATVAKNSTDHEFALLLQLASTYGLDPFAKEIWCIKRNANEPALIMTSRDGYLKIAQRSPDYVGIQSAVVKEGDHFAFNPSDGTVEHRFGAKRGPIQGAWAIVHHKKRMPVACFVEFAEYKGNSPVWTKYPSAMIQKVAEVFALKRQFGVSGLVTQEELDHPGMDPTAQAAPAPDNAPTIRRATVNNHGLTEPQIKRLFAIAKQHDVGNDALKLLMLNNWDIESTRDLTREQYDALCDNLLPNYHAAAGDEPEEVEVEWEPIEDDPMLTALDEATPADVDLGEE